MWRLLSLLAVLVLCDCNKSSGPTANQNSNSSEQAALDEEWAHLYMANCSRPCETCDGSGTRRRHDGSAVECEDCRGHGRVLFVYDDPVAWFNWCIKAMDWLNANRTDLTEEQLSHRVGLMASSFEAESIENGLAQRFADPAACLDWCVGLVKWELANREILLVPPTAFSVTRARLIRGLRSELSFEWGRAVIERLTIEGSKGNVFFTGKVKSVATYRGERASLVESSEHYSAHRHKLTSADLIMIPPVGTRSLPLGSEVAVFGAIVDWQDHLPVVEAYSMP